jgi:hypothetical protein
VLHFSTAIAKTGHQRPFPKKNAFIDMDAVLARGQIKQLRDREWKMGTRNWKTRKPRVHTIVDGCME